MEKYDIDEVRSCYDETAQEYSAAFCDELDGKPFDREVLARFARELPQDGAVVEFGTGSGHIAKFLHDCGARNVVATDISAKALSLAARKYPDLRFESRNMLDTGFKDASLDGIVCFYGIVHFTYAEIDRALAEWKRILKPRGKALFSFHVGEGESMRIDGFLGKPAARATWNFFKVDEIVGLMEKNGIPYDEVVVRHPYLTGEHPTKRCYVQFQKR